MVIVDPKEGIRFGNVDGLQQMYDVIGCNTIDIVVRGINGRMFDFIVDDDGLLKDNPQISAVYDGPDGVKPALVGTLIICSHDNEGNTVDISLDDHMLICDRVRALVVKNKKTEEEYMNWVIQLDDWR